MEGKASLSRRGFLKAAAAVGAALTIQPTLSKVDAASHAIAGSSVAAKEKGRALPRFQPDAIRRNPDIEAELVRDIPAGRMGKPSEIANAVLWLCSPKASFVDGHALLVDGAFSIH